jgi:6-phosphogluconolactonase
MAVIEKFYDDDASLLAELEAHVAGALRESIDERGEAALAVSGGNTPRPLFQRLAKADLDWSKVYITLVDERWVDVSDNASNEKMVRSTLLVERAAKARFVALKNSAATPYEGVAETTARLAVIPRPFDVLMLGMGDDGHTASLFPDAAELHDGLMTQAPCLALTPPVAPHARLTLSAHRILESRQLILHFSGKDKITAYHTALAEGPVVDHPIRFFLRQNEVPIHVYATR